MHDGAPYTCSNLHIRTPHDARTVFQAVSTGHLPMINRRLGPEERHHIRSGSIFVWEERGSSPDSTGIGIERWTDGYRWGPSRVRDGFLFYEEKRSNRDKSGSPFTHDAPLVASRYDRSLLHKQTYTVYADQYRSRKWHLIAYFTQESLSRLDTVDRYAPLTGITPPPHSYPSARQPKGREPGREEHSRPPSPVAAPTPSRVTPYTTSRINATAEHQSHPPSKSLRGQVDVSYSSATTLHGNPSTSSLFTVSRDFGISQLPNPSLASASPMAGVRSYFDEEALLRIEQNHAKPMQDVIYQRTMVGHHGG